MADRSIDQSIIILATATNIIAACIVRTAVL